ncbi:nicotinic acid mononucleotide adenyltransferase [Allomuricauda sp. d1]|uniref:toxin-antitoxin system YwqK family antitoxin n=1 Tax=Allomuricauda sp. d1 TaxID=3136725 RepID=UPI0031D19ABF
MKKLILLLAAVFTIGVYAQDIKPTYEKVGDMVKATYFHDNGEIAQTGFYLNGKLHGQWRMYNEEGKKIATGKYEMGQRSGKWFFWEGQTLKEVDFTDNRITNVIQWNNAEAVAVNK